jgi:hypothetical protein
MNQTNENLTASNEDLTSFCVLVYKNRSFYWQLILPIFSVIFNSLCIFVFIQLIRTQKQTEDLFKYFLVKSIVDTYLSTVFIMNNFFNNEVAAINRQKILKQSYLFFGVYMIFVFQLVSMFLEVAISFNRYRSLTNRTNFRFMDKLSYKIAMLLMFLYSFLFYIYKFFEISIVTAETNSSEIIYLFVSSNFSSIGIVQSIIRDCLLVFIILLINLFTIAEMRSLLNRKKKLLRTMSKEKQASIEIRLTLMVLTISSIAIVSHGLLIIYYMSPNDSIIKTSICFEMISLLVYSFSYVVNFMIYYIFNKNFKNVFDSEISKILKFFKFNFIKSNKKI